MDPLTMGGSALGSLAGSWLQNSWNTQAAQRQQDFQEQMSDTAYQRATADIKAAGFNPAMILSGGGPASSPSGASIAAPNIGNPISAGMETAMQQSKLKKDQEIQETQKGNIASDTANKDANTSNLKLQAALLAQQTASSAKDVEAKELANTLMKKTMQQQINKANIEGQSHVTTELGGISTAFSNSAKKLKDLRDSMITPDDQRNKFKLDNKFKYDPNRDNGNISPFTLP